MGIWDAITEIVEAAAPWSVVEAEAPVDAPKVSPNKSSTTCRKTTRRLRNPSDRSILGCASVIGYSGIY